MANEQHAVNNEGKKNREKLRLHVDNSPAFTGLIDTAYTDSTEMCELINNTFRGIFGDYYGSKIEIAQNRQIVTALYFCENTAKESSKIDAIERVADATKHDTESRLQFINNIVGNSRHQNIYRLTNDGKDILESVIPFAARNNKGQINWDQLVTEGCFNNTPNYYGQNQVYTRVIIDLTRFVRMLYGTKDEKGVDYQFMVNLGNPINPTSSFNGQLMTNKWQLFIMRLNGQIVQDLAKKYGFGSANNLGIVC